MVPSMETITEKNGKKLQKSKIKILILVASCLLCIYLLMSLTGLINQNSKILTQPKPPDFSQCTRIEIHGTPSMHEHLGLSQQFDANFLTPEESIIIENLIIDDKSKIKKFARQINSGYYQGKGIKNDIRGPHLLKRYISLFGYRNEEKIATITIFQPDYIVNETNQRFGYTKELPWPYLLVPSKTKSIIDRIRCGALRLPFYLGLRFATRTNILYPPPDKWSDVLLDYYSSQIGTRLEYLSYFLQCPSIGKGKSHFAMNPICKPDSPKDMVLLFETKNGWNQHGGPELFTFDNHDPKGGCVLLNNGTVKFIRTKKELNQLRWK
jgi:hypothetical protein